MPKLCMIIFVSCILLFAFFLLRPSIPKALVYAALCHTSNNIHWKIYLKVKICCEWLTLWFALRAVLFFGTLWVTWRESMWSHSTINILTRCIILQPTLAKLKCIWMGLWSIMTCFIATNTTANYLIQKITLVYFML